MLIFSLPFPFFSSLSGEVVSGFISVSLLLTALPSVKIIRCWSVLLSSLLLDVDLGLGLH